METLRTAHPKIENQKIIVCADIKQQLLIYTYELESSDNNN